MASSSQRDQLRHDKQSLRLELTPQQLNTAANELQVMCEPFIKDKTCIAGYQAIRGEISVDALLQCARARGTVTALPIVDDETLLFAPFTDQTPMLKKRFGLLEPDVSIDTYLQPKQLDCILVPLVAFDDEANRMGMGGGFYDKSFAFRREGNTRPLLIGVAHELQKSDTVFHEWWDVPLDMVITDKNVYSAQALNVDFMAGDNNHSSLDYCDDSELSYKNNQTEFLDGQRLKFDDAYRFAHLPLVAPEHPLLIPSKSGSSYKNGIHDLTYSIAIPILAKGLLWSQKFIEFYNELKASKFVHKLSWETFDKRKNKLYATICGSLWMVPLRKLSR